MKNLKKTLAVVLAFAMILGMSAISTLAYTDVAEGTVVSEAVSILSNLNILTGFEDGTFRPTETVTRAQMAAIICRVLGYEDQAKSSMGSTIFNDVAADHWASGYINVAQAQQIINGYGDGNYGPEDKVTYEQAVKMIVSALGYDLAAQSKGGYPTGYLAIASAKGITKNANGRVGDAAARSSIAVLVYNSLEVELMDQTSWSTGAAGDEYGMTNETVLSRYLGIKKYEAVVSSTPLTQVISGYDPEAKAEIGFTGAQSWAFRAGSYTLAADAIVGLINADLVDDVNKFLGKKVVAYIGATPDALTGDTMLYAIAEKQGANATLKLTADQLVDGDTTANKLVYKKAGSNKKYDVTLNVTAVYKNFATDSVTANTDAILGEFTNGGTIELIDSNTAALGYETLIITDYVEEAVVEEVETDDTDIFFTLYTGSLDDIDTESETELVIVYKDGEVAEATAIAAGDTVTTAPIGTHARVLFVSSKNVTGSVDGLDNKGKVEIAGEYYAPSAASLYTDTGLFGMEGIFYLNVDGQIAYADASMAKGGYGFILNVGKEGSMGSKYFATIVNADGSVKAYDFAKAVKYNDVAGKTPLEVATALATIMEATADVFDNTDPIEPTATKLAATYTAEEAYAHVDTAKNLVFEVKIKNDEIKELKAVVAGAPAQSKYNETTKSLGAKTFDETSVMFALEGAYNADAPVEEDNIKVGKVVEMLADEEQYYVSLSASAIENGIYKAAIGYQLATSIANDSEAIVITNKTKKSYADDAAVVIEGIQGGKEVTYILYNEDGFRSANGFAVDNLAVGDIILTSAASAEGVVGDFMVLYDRDTDTVTAGFQDSLYNTDKFVAGNKDYIAKSFTSATKAADDNYIWFDEAVTGVATDVEDGKYYMVMQKNANCVMVDYTEDASEPEISKKSLSKSVIGNPTKYDAKVFVRVIDEVVVDVIVYRTLD